MNRGDRRVLLLAAAITVAIGLLDFLTPADVDFTEFYMVPVVLVAWFIGWRSAVAFGLFAAVTEFVVDDLLRDLVLATALWNGLSRIGVFVALAVVTDRLYRERTARQAAYDLERRHWESVDADRNALLRVLGREFPRPLHALDWFVRTFEEPLVRNSSEAMRAQYRALRHHIQEVAFLATDLIANGRMDPSALRLDPKQVELKQVVTEAADESPARARVLLSLASEPLMVHADADLLRQAFAGVIDRTVGRGIDAIVRAAARRARRRARRRVALPDGARDQGDDVGLRRADHRDGTRCDLPSESGAALRQHRAR